MSAYASTKTKAMLGDREVWIEHVLADDGSGLQSIVGVDVFAVDTGEVIGGTSRGEVVRVFRNEHETDRIEICLEPRKPGSNVLFAIGGGY